MWNLALWHTSHCPRKYQLKIQVVLTCLLRLTSFDHVSEPRSYFPRPVWKTPNSLILHSSTNHTTQDYTSSCWKYFTTIATHPHIDQFEAPQSAPFQTTQPNITHKKTINHQQTPMVWLMKPNKNINEKQKRALKKETFQDFNVNFDPLCIFIL